MISPKLRSIYLFVKNIKISQAFYECLGLEVDVVSDSFARVNSGDLLLEMGTAELTTSYDPNWQQPGLPSTNTIGFEYTSDNQVDEVYAQITGAGYTGHLAPCTPPWQARFAIVKDPDGNQIGLHGPRSRDADQQREEGDSHEQS